MQWFEFIRVRTSADQARELLASLPQAARSFEAEPGVEMCAVMRHGLYDGDIAVALAHDDDAGARHTAQARELADHLSTYGLVDHNVWQKVYPPDTCALPTDSAPAIMPASTVDTTDHRE